MKRFLIYAMSLTFIIGIMAFEILSPTGKAGYSGAPGDGNCTSCHDGTVNSGSASAAITSSPSLSGGYTPGSDHTISVTISNSSSPNDKLFGVDAVALLSSGANGGTVTITNTTLTKIKTHTVGSNTRTHVVHTGSGNVGPNTQTFSFKWTAPAAGKGTVTIYASLLAADGDGGTTGDQVYTTSLAATEITTSVLSPPQLIYPSNNAIDRLLTEQFRWNKATDAQSYLIQISKDAAFSNILFQGNVGADTFKLINILASETDYYWHVASVNTSGTSAYSGTWKLSTSYKAIVLQTPTNQKVNVPINTKLTWLANPAGTQYQVQISKVADFATTVIDTKVDNVLEYQNTALEYYKNYYWRVRLVVGTRVGLWSDVWSFKTTIKVPDLVYPANNAIDRQLTEQFKWNKVLSAQTYYIQIAKDEAFTNIVFDGNVGTDTFKLAANLLPETEYFWHVSSVTTEGASEYSATWKFKTSLKATVLKTPENQKVNLPLNTKLVWLPNTSGTQYQIQISKTDDFKTTIVDETVNIVLEYQTNKLEYYQSYFWRVRVVVGTSFGIWSDAWSFKTGIKATDLISPTDKAVDQATALKLKWNEVVGATYYHLQVSKNADFTDLVYNKDSLTKAEQNVDALLPSINYFWRVNDWNLESFGIAQWSPVWSFTTSQVVLFLLNPENGTGSLTIPVQLSWYPAATAEYYHLQLAKDADFVNVVFDKDSIFDTKYLLSEIDITPGTNYYWHIKGVGAQYSTPWSGAWQFSTGGVFVKESNQFSSIKLYPNPSGSRAVLKISFTESSTAKIIITSSDGKIIKTDMLDLKPGDTSYEIDTNPLASGTYYITIIAPSGFITRELVVTK